MTHLDIGNNENDMYFCVYQIPYPGIGKLKDVRDKFWDEDVRVGRFCISIGRPERDLRWGTVRPRTTIFDNPDEDREVDALLRLMSG